MLSAIDSY